MTFAIPGKSNTVIKFCEKRFVFKCSGRPLHTLIAQCVVASIETIYTSMVTYTVCNKSHWYLHDFKFVNLSDRATVITKVL